MPEFILYCAGLLFIYCIVYMLLELSKVIAKNRKENFKPTWHHRNCFCHYCKKSTE